MLGIVITAIAAISQQDLIDLYCDQPQAGVINVYSRAIKYRRDDGTIQRVQPEWVGNESRGDRFKARKRSDGGMSYHFGDDHLTFLSPTIMPGGTSRDVIAESSFIEPSDPTVRHDLFPGGVKETITLTEPPRAQRDFRVRWDMLLSQRIRTRLVNDQLVIEDTAGNFMARILPIIAVDAKGRRIQANLRIVGNTLEASFAGNWFDDSNRAYPVEIDPTVDTDPAAAILFSTYENVPFDPIQYRTAWMKILLPTFSAGTTIDSAVFKDYCTSWGGRDPTTNNKFTSDTSWTEASNVATMEAITTAAGAALTTTAVTASGAWYDHTVTGDAFSGMIKLYADTNNAPGACTVILDANGNGATSISSGASTYSLGEESYDSCNFDGYNGTNKPYITITYTGSLQVQAGGSGTVGVLMF